MIDFNKKDFDKMPNPTISARLTIYIDSDFDSKQIENVLAFKAKFVKQKSQQKLSPVTNKIPSGYIVFMAKEISTRNENEVVLPMIDYLFERKTQIEQIQKKYNARMVLLVESLLKSFKNSNLKLEPEYISKLSQLNIGLEHNIEF